MNTKVMMMALILCGYAGVQADDARALISTSPGGAFTQYSVEEDVGECEIVSYEWEWNGEVTDHDSSFLVSQFDFPNFENQDLIAKHAQAYLVEAIRKGYALFFNRWIWLNLFYKEKTVLYSLLHGGYFNADYIKPMSGDDKEVVITYIREQSTLKECSDCFCDELLGGKWVNADVLKNRIAECVEQLVSGARCGVK